MVDSSSQKQLVVHHGLHELEFFLALVLWQLVELRQLLQLDGLVFLHDFEGLLLLDLCYVAILLHLIVLHIHEVVKRRVFDFLDLLPIFFRDHVQAH